MKRNLKIILSIIGIVLGIGIVGGTIYLAKNNLASTSGVNSTSQSGNRMTPPSDNTNNNNSNMGEPPTKPSDDTNSNSSNSTTNTPSNSTTMTPTSMPNNNSTNSNSNSSTPSMPSDMSLVKSVSLTTWYIVAIIVGTLIFSISIIYLIMSMFGGKNIFVSGDKIVIFVLINILVTSILTYGIITYTNNYVLTSSTSNNNATQAPESNSTATSSVSASGATSVSGETKTLSDTYTSTSSDVNAILVNNAGNATITDSKITKSGDTTNTENSEFYGINAAVLVQASSTATIKNTKITTQSKGSNAVFATGTDAKIYISDTTINTSSDSSRGLDATYGGYIEGNNLTISTKGTSCATLATDRGEGTVTVSDSTLKTEGKGSPIIYSTGNITLTDSKGTATNAQAAVIEGKNSATLNNSTITTYAIGNRNDVDNAGVMIYQSMSGDAGEGTGTFTATDSKIIIDSSSNVYKTAPMFFVTNTSAPINLTNTELNYGSNILLSAKGTSEWGNTGSNGGNVTLNATNEKLNGNIVLDNLSTLALTLSSSTYSGTINADNTASSISINLYKSSTIELTSDSYITTLSDSDTTYSNIKTNGYTLYVNGSKLDI